MSQQCSERPIFITEGLGRLSLEYSFTIDPFYHATLKTDPLAFGLIEIFVFKVSTIVHGMNIFYLGDVWTCEKG